MENKELIYEMAKRLDLVISSKKDFHPNIINVKINIQIADSINSCIAVFIVIILTKIINLIK